ncbi:MAG: sporulation protein YtxC [Chitinophagales bacterium]
MNYTLELASQSGTEHIRDRLESSFSWLRERGYNLNIDEKPGTIKVLMVTLTGPSEFGLFHDEDIVYIFQHQLAEILSETITTWWEEDLTRRQIEKTCKLLSNEEQAQLVAKSVDFLRHCNDNESLNLLLKFGRKNKISHRILEHLHQADRLNVDGLIRFALRDYLREIRFAVELAYEEYKNEKQYNEFVKLLKYFVDTQPPKVMEVNIMVFEEGNFSLWDEKGEPIKQDLIDFYSNEDITGDNTTLEDVLISILITISPRRIVFHSTKGLFNNDATKVIRKVFKNRFLVCPGCERCQRIQSPGDQDRLV